MKIKNLEEIDGRRGKKYLSLSTEGEVETKKRRGAGEEFHRLKKVIEGRKDHPEIQRQKSRDPKKARAL